MDDSANEYDNENASVSIKPDPEILYETRDGANCRTVNSSLEHMDEGDDFNHSTNKSRRRSRRTRVRNVRYRSDDDVIALSPENIKQNGKNSDKDFLEQEPSSSTARRATCPKNNDVAKSKHMSVNNSMGEVLRQIGLYEELFDFMDARGITAEALKYMQTRHIDELFKDTHLDTKIIFEHRLIDWQNKMGNCEVTTTQSINNNLNSSFKQMLPETVFSNLSKVLTTAVQQTINTVLLEFKQAYLKQTEDKSNIYSKEVPNERIPLKNIKSEPNHGTVDEIIIPDKRPNSVVRQTSNKVKNEILLSNRSIDLTISNQSKRRKLDSDTSVQEIIIASPSCQHLFDEYENTGLLTINDRSEIVHCIVDFFIRNKFVLTIARCKEIAEEIVQLFPTESTGTYFIQANKNRPPKGKIWERYQSRKRTIRKSVPVNSRPETLKTDTSPSDLEDLHANKADWSEMQAMCSQMKHITDDKELLAKWRESFAFRRHQLQTGSFSNWKLYFDEYPFCKQQNYAEFIESDLEALYPDLKFNDFLWDEFMENFSIYFLNRLKHPKSKHLYDQLTSMENLSTSTDYVAIKVIELLHAALKPYTDKIQSSEEAQRKFTVEVSDLSDLKKVVIERKKHCTEHNIQAKPYIAVVGQSKTYSNFSVILDSTGFSCDNYKDSLILCFNLYLFFDISFPLEFLNVWGFIQKYFFDKPLLVNNPRVETFINDLRAQKLASLDIKTSVNGKKLHKDF
ncbi:uncharacterized protein LOC135951935 isoform X2 [Calliphora vicina]|uniref:uncharacterized protein LOC135951935 isoform X2 n=1 Tax=Calliphora vicina TaxID=7373 RepID=UPI00325B077B